MLNFGALKSLTKGTKLDKSKTINVTNESALRACKMIVEFVFEFNVILKCFGFPITIKCDYYEEILKTKTVPHALIENLKPIINGEYIGAPPLSAIATTMVALYKNFSYYAFKDTGKCRCGKNWDDCGLCGKNQYLQGNCQSGKTLILAILFWLTPILNKLLRGVINFPIVSVPNNKNLHYGSKEEIDVSLRLFANLEVQNNKTGEVIAGNYVMELIENSTPGILTEDMINKRNHPEIRRLISVLEKIDKDSTEKAPLEITLFIDENHYGSAKDGVQDNLVKMFDQRGYGVREIGITATGSEYQNTRSFDVTLVYMGDGYQGFTKYNGRMSPTLPGAKITRQKFKVLEREWPNLGIFLMRNPVNGLVLYDCLKSTKTYYKFWKINNNSKVKFDDIDPALEKEIEEERIFWIKKLAAELVPIWSKLLTKKHPVGFLRAFPTIINCKILHDEMSRLASKLTKGKFTILKFYGTPLPEEFGKSTKTKSIKKVLLDHYVKPGKRVLVIASTGRSNMGDSYPKSTKHFMDLYESQYSYNTMVQGTIGRSQGYGKESTVWLREPYFNEIMQYEKEGFPPKNSSKNFGPRDEILGKPGRQSTHVIIMSELPSEYTDQNIIVDKDLLEQVMVNLNRYKRLDGGSSVEANIDLYNLFSADVLNRLSEESGFLLPPKWGYIKDKNQYGGIHKGKPVAWGLRKSKSYEDFLLQGSPNAKNIRMKESNIFRPQIIFKSDPIDFIDDLNDERYCVKAGKGWKPSSTLVKTHPLWDSIKLVPMMIYLPLIGAKKLNSGRESICNTKKSRVYDESNNDQIIKADEAVQEMLEKKIYELYKHLEEK